MLTTTLCLLRGVLRAARRIKVFSSISFCFSYSYVRQTKLARTFPIHNWHTHSPRLTEPRMSSRHQSEASKWRHDAYFATVVRGCCRGCRCRFRHQLKLSLLARAPSCPRLRPRCCCCCCRRTAAVGTPYERRQNGLLHAETAGDSKRGCRIVTNRI